MLRKILCRVRQVPARILNKEARVFLYYQGLTQEERVKIYDEINTKQQEYLELMIPSPVFQAGENIIKLSRCTQKELEEIRSLSDGEILEKVAEEYRFMYAFTQGGTGVSTSDVTLMNLILMEVEKRAVSNPEYEIRLQKLVTRIEAE